MMNADAIKLIQDTAIQAENTINNHLTDTTDYPCIALPSQLKIEPLERFNAQRNRFRAEMKSPSISDFVAYVVRRENERLEGEAPKSLTFIDADKLTAKTLLNIGNTAQPGHGDDTAVLTVAKSPAYSALLDLTHKNKFSQQELLDWLDDWHIEVTAQNDQGAEIPRAKAQSAIRKIKITAKIEAENETRNTGHTKTAFEQIDASALDGIPHQFTFTCKPAEELDECAFILRLYVSQGPQAPVCALRIMQFEAQQERIAQNFKQVLHAALSASSVLFIGDLTIK